MRTDFNNKPQWLDLTRAMLIKNDILNFVETEPGLAPAIIWELKIEENHMAMETSTRIIKKDVNIDIFNNNIKITNLKEMWEELRFACSQIGQSVIHSILQKYLNYPRNIKPKRFKKSVISWFADVYFLIKRLWSAITPNCDIWNNNTIVVTVNSLHNDFRTTINSIFKSGDKSIDKI